MSRALAGRHSVWAFGIIVALGAAVVPGDAVRAATTGGRCAAAKLRAASRKASGKLACHQAAIAHGAAPDPACLARVEVRFNGAFARAESRGGCATTMDAASVETIVNQFVNDLVSALPPATSTTTTTTTTSTASTAAGSCALQGGFCSGSCSGAGETCQYAPSCCCGCTPVCVCSASTLTTCTMPPVCPTTTTLP